jgi:hypothetical protein
LFNSVGEQWVQTGTSSYDLITTNRPWTFNFSERIKWTDFYEGTAPAFPTGGIRNYSLYIGLRAPRSAYWWAMDPSANFWAQNL